MSGPHGELTWMDQPEDWADRLAVAITSFVQTLTGQPFRTDADEVRRFFPMSHDSLREALAADERGGGEERIDATTLALAIDAVDHEDHESGVVGRGRKVDRIIAKYEALWASPWSRVR